MKLPNTNVQVERHGNMVETEFNIGDPWLLLEYMTKNVYSDILRVIVQEIGSNGRDAHREVGQKRHIRIKLPNRFDPTLQFRDWGPGMGPDRIHGIFKSYGKSSKRDSNTQTGGFGIGGKTPWAYTDVFTIRTIALENGTLTLREYSAIKGEDRSLKLIEMGDPTPIDVNDPNVPDDDKHTGTTISIIAKREDWDNFENKVIEITKWWNADEKPEIVGKDPTPEYPDMSIMYEGSNWKVLNTAHRNQQDSYYNRSGEPTVVVDGIPYKLHRDSLTLDDHLTSLIDGRIVLFFNVGELTLALSRENLQYDDRTKAALIDRLKNVYDSLVVQVNDNLKSCTSLREAILKYQELKRSFAISEFVKKAEWNGINVDRERFVIDHNGASAREYTREGNAATGFKIRSKETHHIGVNNDTLIVLNDTGENKAVLRLYTLFNNNPGVSSIQVITPKTILVNGVDTWETEKARIHLDLLEVTPFSKVEKFKREYISKEDRGRVIKAYAFNNTYRSRPRAMWSEIDIDMEDGDGVYVTLDRGTAQDFNHSCLYDAYKALKALGNDINIIGVPVRFVGKLGDGWVGLADYVRSKMQELAANIDFKSIAEYRKLQGLSITHSFGHAILETNLETLIDDKTCSFVKWIERSREIEKLSASHNANYETYCKLAGFVGGKDGLPEIIDDLENVVSDCKTNYALILAMLNTMRYHGNIDDNKEELAIYINARNQSLTLKAVAI